jgi:hypothetical protein
MRWHLSLYKEKMKKCNGLFYPTICGPFYPTLNGLFHPTLTVKAVQKIQTPMETLYASKESGNEDDKEQQMYEMYLYLKRKFESEPGNKDSDQ